MTTHEERLGRLEQQLRSSRCQVTALAAVVAVVVCTAAAQRQFGDLICSTLQVKSDAGRTITALRQNGDVEVGGSLKVKGPFEGLGGRCVAWCTYDISANKIYGVDVKTVRRIRAGEYEFTLDKKISGKNICVLVSGNNGVAQINSSLQDHLRGKIVVFHHQVWDAPTGKIYGATQRVDTGEISLAVIAE
jgi:hypothetical protein